MSIPLYEHPVWQTTPEQVMRPGGLTVTERAFSLCNLAGGSRVLDVGCGRGVTLRHLTARYGLRGVGVDVSAVLLSGAKQAGEGVVYALAKGERLPLADECMDAVFSECTLSLFEAETALGECVRVLKPDGYFVLSDLYARKAEGIEALRRLPLESCLRAAMSREEIERLVAACGLQVLAWQDCSEDLKHFPLCTLSTAASIHPFDLVIAAGKAKLGYYFLVAQKKEGA